MLSTLSGLFGCGNSDGTNDGATSDTGSYVAKLVFPEEIPRIETDSEGDSDADTAPIDCKAAEIASIHCNLYSADGNLMTEKRWQCSQGKGVVENVPLGNSITVEVTAEDNDGTVLLRGKDQNVTIAADQPTQGGKIQLEWANIPDVTADGEPKTLVFDWSHINFPANVVRYQLQIDPDGAEETYQFSPVRGADRIEGTSITLTIPVHLTDWVTAVYRIAALDSADNEIAVSGEVGLISSILSEEVIGYFKASNTGSEDLFGFSIAISADGGTLAVGAMAEASSATGVDGQQEDDSHYGSGAVYLFAMDNTGKWYQQAYLKASNSYFGIAFGASVALSEDGCTLAVGALFEGNNILGFAPESGSGAVYIFSRNEAGNWNEQALLKASNEESEDQFGYSVALSSDGNTLAVGAINEDSAALEPYPYSDETDNSAENSGAVYIFRRTSGITWDQEAYIKASNPDAGDNFGLSVALSSNGNILAVGAPYEDDAATGTDDGPNEIDNDDAENSGAVYIYSRYSDILWMQEAYIKASNRESNDRFGLSVALSANGNILAVGATGEQSAATGSTGEGQDDNNAENSGAVYVFSRSAILWRQQAYLKASNTDSGDAFGASVSLSVNGDLLAVGAPLESSNAIGINGTQENNDAFRAGAVYFFSAVNDLWQQTAYIKASNARGDSLFGLRVALSKDGADLAVAAMDESSAATGINGNQDNNTLSSAGAVYLY